MADNDAAQMKHLYALAQITQNKLDSSGGASRSAVLLTSNNSDNDVVQFKHLAALAKVTNTKLAASTGKSERNLKLSSSTANVSTAAGSNIIVTFEGDGSPYIEFDSINPVNAAFGIRLAKFADDKWHLTAGMFDSGEVPSTSELISATVRVCLPETDSYAAAQAQITFTKVTPADERDTIDEPVFVLASTAEANDTGETIYRYIADSLFDYGTVYVVEFDEENPAHSVAVGYDREAQLNLFVMTRAPQYYEGCSVTIAFAGNDKYLPAEFTVELEG